MASDKKAGASCLGSESGQCLPDEWTAFADDLAAVLGQLEADQWLILAARRGNRFLQFYCQGAHGLRVEVTSNHFLKGKDRLSRRQMAWLGEHGWCAPTGTPQQATPERDPEGSPNYYVDVSASVPVFEIARLAIDALVNGLALRHPDALTLESFDAKGRSLTLAVPECERIMTRRNAPLMEQVLKVFRKVSGVADLELNEDCDVSVRYGDIMVSAFQLDDKIRLFAPLVTEVTETPALLRKLNRINDGEHRIRCCLHGELVYAALDVPAAPFVPAHLAAALGEFSEVAEGLAIVMHAESSGRAVLDPFAMATGFH